VAHFGESVRCRIKRRTAPSDAGSWSGSGFSMSGLTIRPSESLPNRRPGHHRRRLNSCDAADTRRARTPQIRVIALSFTPFIPQCPSSTSRSLQPPPLDSRIGRVAHVDIGAAVPHSSHLHRRPTACGFPECLLPGSPIVPRRRIEIRPNHSGRTTRRQNGLKRMVRSER